MNCAMMSDRSVTLKVATHNGLFHADETLAVALIEFFLQRSVSIFRVKHDHTDFDMYDMVIDIGRQHDNVKFFDHHQYKGPPSAVRLIYDHLMASKDYKILELEELVDMVSEFDAGTTTFNKFELPSLIAKLNDDNIHSDKQDFNFRKAVAFLYDIVASIVKRDIDIRATGTIIANEAIFDTSTGTMWFPKYLKGWQNFINGELRPDVKRVVWYDDFRDRWSIQIPTINKESRVFVGLGLIPSDLMNFVHASGFYGVCSDKVKLEQYIELHVNTSLEHIKNT